VSAQVRANERDDLAGARADPAKDGCVSGAKAQYGKI
jgi:hypothetical protein